MSIAYGGIGRKAKRTGAVMLVLAALIAWLAPMPAAVRAEGEGGIVIQSEIGFDSTYKDGKWTRLRLTLTNMTGRDLKGEAVFSAVQTNGNRQIVHFAVPAELPRETPIVVEMTVPGQPYDSGSNRIRFFEGSMHEGKSVPFTTGRQYVNAAPSNGTVIGIVARDPDTLNFLPILSSQGYSIKTVAIADEDLPGESLRLDSLDYLVLNDVPAGGWPASVVEAIRGWVQRGGRLVIAGGAGYAKTAEPFGDLLPIKPEGTATIAAAPGLEAIGGKPLDIDRPITLSTGTVQSGTVTLSEGAVPIAAERPYGKGTVVYVAFDPALEPFASWPGSPDLWARMLAGSGLSPSIVQIGFGYNDWEMLNLLNHFPSLRSPELGTLVIFFAVYVLLVAPALYILLKRLDRREWAWWLIPLVSIASSAAIFAVGASDKTNVLAHSVRTVELTGDGRAERSASAAVFVPNGGKVTATFDEGAVLLPYWEDDLAGDVNIDAARGERVVRHAAGHTEAEWRDVPFWSVRKTAVHLGSSDGFGQFEVDAVYSGGSLDVTVTNDTASDLKRVSFLMNGQAYVIGDLRRGETGKRSIPYFTTSFHYGMSQYGSQLFPYAGNGRDEYYRERGQLDAYMNKEWQKNPSGASYPLVVGFSRDEDGWFEVDGAPIASDNATMWVQPFRWSPNAGASIVPGMVKPNITVNAMQGFGYDAFTNRYDLSNGSIEFEYMLPWEGKGYRSVSVYHYETAQVPNASLSVWNERSGEWEPVAMTPRDVPLPAPPEAYMTPKRTIRMKLEVTGNIGYALPGIGLEGGDAE